MATMQPAGTPWHLWVVGIVSLPGMMTGQILAGSDPLVAVKYQIVVMFMLAAATALGCILSALLAYRRLFNTRHQLEGHLVRSGKKEGSPRGPRPSTP